MCGRFVATRPPDQLAAYFGAEQGETALEPSTNVAPTNDVYAVLEDGEGRHLDALHWGLVPFWAKDPKVGNRMINARAETVATKNAYRHAFKKKRCIIPADGFYEWKKLAGAKRKQPYFIHRPDGDPFPFAGLWETWRDEETDRVIRSCTILTGEPNDAMAEIHDRMPVMLSPEVWDTWLDPENHDVEALQALLVPAPSGLIAFHTVSTDVNNPRNKDAHLPYPAEPIALGDEDAG